MQVPKWRIRTGRKYIEGHSFNCFKVVIFVMIFHLLCGIGNMTYRTCLLCSKKRPIFDVQKRTDVS